MLNRSVKNSNWVWKAILVVLALLIICGVVYHQWGFSLDPTVEGYPSSHPNPLRDAYNESGRLRPPVVDSARTVEYSGLMRKGVLVGLDDLKNGNLPADFRERISAAATHVELTEKMRVMCSKDKFESKYSYDKNTILGKGSYGAVYLGNANGSPDQNLAIKIAGISKGVEKHLITELRVLQNLQHENIIKYYDCFVDDAITHSDGSMGDGLIIVTERATADLDNYITHSTANLEVDDIKRWIVDILHGMLFLHENNVLHRDSKLDNFVIVNGKVKIIDMGLAYIMSDDDDRAETGIGIVAPNHARGFFPAAPEVGSRYSKPMDVYRLGIAFKNMLVSLYLKQSGQAIDFYVNVQKYFGDLDLLDLIKRAITISPKRRPSIRQMLKHPSLRGFQDMA